ncbi:MAG: adenylate/guanylate cyclase domain-containing protein [Deltaproteobacteria bacterium]|nr:adenylate/guanylate cyclase domain-containing protein [Deltaproteobacteria bacterium]
MRTHNAGQAKDEQIHVRIGIHLGDVVQKDSDVFGDDVNIAARLQTLADPDTICISQVVYKEVEKKLTLGTVVSLGRPKLKNIAERFQVYALLPQAPNGFRQKLQVQRLKLSRRVGTAHRLAVVGVLLVTLTLVAVRYFPFLFPSPQPPTPSTPEAPALPDKPSIVVLPFVNMSEDPKQEYFSDGITEDITSDLSKIASLFVIARNSAFSYKGKSPKVQDVGREMGVRYVLEGSVRRADNQVRITAQLIDATTGGHLWSERYDRGLKDIFALQDEIRQKIVFALKVKLTPEEQERFQRASTNNLEAYDYWLHGHELSLRSLQERQKELNEQARQQYEKAIELDPQYAGAYAWLGFTYFQDGFYLWKDRTQMLDRATDLAQRAVALDDSLSTPHWILGIVYVFKMQHDQAIGEGEWAVVLDANDADSYVSLGNALAFAGRPEEGIGLIEKAMRLNPRYPPRYLNFLGLAYLTAGQYEEAIVPLKKAVTLSPNFAPAHGNLAICYAELGRLEEARAELVEFLRISPNASLEMTRQNVPYKDPADLERYLDGLRKAGLK